ncbi:MAG: dihydropteroate synthase [Endozoicomonadaceae bacterium]|nr:dihydropteroate synthase [Endozoicomonadaceae bacterium]
MQSLFNCSERFLDLSRPRIMGILNVTPDSFSDKGRYNTLDKAVRHAVEMVDAGADIIDVGGESTRPGAQTVTIQENIDRVVPVIECLRRELDVVISIDTSEADVMRAGAAAGAGILNDVRALTRKDALQTAAELNLPVILMHSLCEQPKPGVMPQYDDVVVTVKNYLSDRLVAAVEAGINREHIILDPGFGSGMFGKAPQHDLEMVRRFTEFLDLDMPVLAGLSRKSFMGAILDRPVSDRLPASLAVAALVLNAGAHILRVHDVAESVDVMKLVMALKAFDATA